MSLARGAPHLVLDIWYQGPFPYPIHRLIPVIRLLGFWVWDELRVLPVLKENVPHEDIGRKLGTQADRADWLPPALLCDGPVQERKDHYGPLPRSAPSY